MRAGLGQILAGGLTSAAVVAGFYVIPAAGEGSGVVARSESVVHAVLEAASSAAPGGSSSASSSGGGGGGTATTTATEPPSTSTPALLVPGPPAGGAGAGGGEAEEPSTTAPEDESTVAEPDDDNTGIIVSLVISGLLVVALVLGLLTYRYWRTTRPVKLPPAEDEEADHTIVTSGDRTPARSDNGEVRSSPLRAGERSSH